MDAHGGHICSLFYGSAHKITLQIQSEKEFVPFSKRGAVLNWTS